MNRLAKKRREIQPRKIRKHSDIVRSHEERLIVVGDREPTVSGFTISGYSGKFETFFEMLVPNAMTPTFKHPTKARVYRVMGGSGYFQKFGEENKVESLPISKGDEFTCLPNVSYRVLSSTVKLELYVTQEAKYNAKLETVAPAEVLQDISSDELVSVTLDEKLRSYGVGMRRGDSSIKARENIAAQRGRRAVVETSRSGPDIDTFSRNSAAGINAAPISSFSEEGAG